MGFLWQKSLNFDGLNRTVARGKLSIEQNSRLPSGFSKNSTDNAQAIEAASLLRLNEILKEAEQS